MYIFKLSQVKQGTSKVQKSIYIPSSHATYESFKALTSSTSSPPFLLVVWNNLPYTTFEVARKVLLTEPAIETPFYKFLWCFSRVDSGSYGAFSLDVKSVLNENLGGILGGTQC
jgi:hypothetical protein